jgi:hypothetical protein
MDLPLQAAPFSQAKEASRLACQKRHICPANICSKSALIVAENALNLHNVRMTFKILACLLAVSTLASGQSGVLREVWTQVDGGTINALVTSPNYPEAPLFSTLQTEFRSATNWGDRYGVRMRAFLTAQNPDALQAMAQTFANAARRGFWLSRRNSAMTMLRDMLGDPAPMGLAS